MEKIPFEKLHGKEFVDLPETVPEIKFPLETVGIRNRPHYITVLDPFAGKETHLLTEIKVNLNLPGNQKGLHMSRIEAGLHFMKSKKTLPLKDYAAELCKYLSETLRQENCEVEIVAFYEKNVYKNVSKPSHELMKLHVAVSHKKNDIKTKIGITLPIINACPCTQRWGMRDFYGYLKSKGIEKDDIEELVKSAPLQAHTNGGDVRLFVGSGNVSFQDLYEVIENSSPIARELLSGEDEHMVVKESHKRGFFCEDIARAVVSNFVKKFENSLDPNTDVEIFVDIDESIHFHNIYTEIRDTFGNIERKLK